MAHLAMVNSIPAPATGTNTTDPALLTAINALCASMSAQQEQMAKMQAAHLAQSIKSAAKLPVLKDPGLKAAAGCAVECIKLNVDEGARAAFVERLEVIKQVDGLEIPGWDFTNRAELLSEAEQAFRADPNLSEADLRTLVFSRGVPKGLVKPKQGSSEAAFQAAMAGMPGVGGLGNPFYSANVMPHFAAMIQAAAAAAPAPVPAAVAATPQALQMPVSGQGMLFGQYGLQQPSVQFVVPGMPGQVVQGQGGQKKPVRCYACQQMGHYANRCPARTASGANTTAIVRQ
ncbi:hypothetical protein OEZ86_006397 [Tetradesmus obliquus]|nr:hypothetical protein OEZ86_006397 [Tetradesmus obliquus]